jgi:phasin
MTRSSSKRGTRKAHATRRKIAPKPAAEKDSGTRRKITPKVAAQKTRVTHSKTASKVAAETERAIYRKTAAQFEAFRDNQVPHSMRALAESGVAQTRELYERSKNAVEAVLESWQKSFGAAGQGAIALNRKIFDIAERNINTGFDLATDLAGAKNFAEVMELQTSYWRKQLDQLRAQAEEVRTLSTKIAGNVAEPMKAQVTRVHKAN